jgi:acyl-CoA synthetase (AMP-forming)/AMP-acid ligase II
LPVVLRGPTDRQSLCELLPTIKAVVAAACPSILLSTDKILKLLAKESAAREAGFGTFDFVAMRLRCNKIASFAVWPETASVDTLPSKGVETCVIPERPDRPACIEFTVSPTGVLAGVVVTHAELLALAMTVQASNRVTASSVVLVTADPLFGFAFLAWAVLPVMAGCRGVLLSPDAVWATPELWLQTVAKLGATVTVATFAHLTLSLGLLTGRERLAFALHKLERCLVVCPDRPRHALLQAFAVAFAPHGLRASAVVPVAVSRVCTALALAPASQLTAAAEGLAPALPPLYLDLAALQADTVRIMERGSPLAVAVPSAGLLLPSARVRVLSLATGELCSSRAIGEIWISSAYNRAGYAGLRPELEAQLTAADFKRRFPGDAGRSFARTGLMGFLDQGQLFVTGSLDETLLIRGYRHNPEDLERTLERCHAAVAAGASMVFVYDRLLFVAVELDAADTAGPALAPVLTSALLDEHGVVAHVVACFDAGALPVSRNGEKQRARLREAFVAGEVAPRFLAVNRRL